MLPVAQAESIIWDLVQPLTAGDPTAVDVVALADAHDRILAASISSPLDFPHWDNSAMDGYAVRFADVQACTSSVPVTLTVVEDIPAGKPPQLFLQAGEAARVFTGSMVPAGADVVVMQEHTHRNGNYVTIHAAPAAPGEFIRQQGAFRRVGDQLLPAGIVLTAADLAILAAAQCLHVPVYRRPVVAILSTGSELITPEQPLQPGKLVDSNQLALATLVAQSGGIPRCLGIVPDRPAALQAAIVQALAQADMIVSSGGVSVGDYDYVEQILTDLGATLHIRAVAIKPGKPLTVATFNGFGNRSRDGLPSVQGQPTQENQPRSLSTQLYFGLPGNPVSALITFWRFVQPALRKFMGLTKGWQPQFVTAIASESLTADRKRETYLWGHITLKEGQYHFTPAPGSQSSGNLVNLSQTNALARLSVGQGTILPGQPVAVLLV